MNIEEVRSGATTLLKNLGRAVKGLDEELRLIVASLLANGHVLLEGVPGVAKTTIVRGLARLLGLDGEKSFTHGNVSYRGWSRIQFTPDLMPSDITGSLVFNPVTREFEPRLGPIFAYIVLADEINRAIPRTQSALLQAMQEREVTIGGTTYPLEIREEGKFFFVLATQNPVEQEGTYPLPEAQLDRFTMRVIVGYPKSMELEKEVYRLHLRGLREPVEELEPVLEPGWVIPAQEAVSKGIAVPEGVLEYVTRFIRFTRPEVVKEIGDYIELGASPRAGIALLRVAKAYAAICGSREVRREHVDAVAFAVLNHRLIPSPERLAELSVSEGRYAARYRVVEEALRLAAKLAS